MTFEVAKRAIDYLLEYPFESDCVQWDFIGGEPTLEMELIDKISDYIKIRMLRLIINGLITISFLWEQMESCMTAN